MKNLKLTKISVFKPEIHIFLRTSLCLPLITYGLEAINLRATDYLLLDNLLNNSLAKLFNVSHDTVVLHDIRFYFGIASMKTLCISRHMKFLLKAMSVNNIAVRTALLILQDERISLCDSVSVDIDCSLRTFCSAVTSFYS